MNAQLSMLWVSKNLLHVPRILGTTNLNPMNFTNSTKKSLNISPQSEQENCNAWNSEVQNGGHHKGTIK